MKYKSSKTRWLLFVILTEVSNLYGQVTNLIPNGSFEEFSHCPTKYTTKASDFEGVHWFSPSKGTPDLYSNCSINNITGVPNNWSGSDLPAEGDNYAGIFLADSHMDRYREYLSIELKDTLKRGHEYNLTIFCKPSRYSKYAVDNIQFVLSKYIITTPDSDNYLKYKNVNEIRFPEPDNLNGWLKFNLKYKAKGGEHFFTIGNFDKPKIAELTQLYEGAAKSPMIGFSAYYLIDQIILTPVINEEVGIPVVEYPLDKRFELETVYFDFDDSQVRKRSFAELNQLAEFLMKSKALTLIIQGHADKVGSDEYNMHLSKRRAESVSLYLTGKGVNASQIRTEWFGERKTISEFDDKNRRVEFEIIRNN